MASEKNTEILDFFFDKECKAAEDSFRSTLFSNDVENSQKQFKEELFSDDPMEWKTEPSDFNMEDLLGSYLTEDMTSSEGLPGEQVSLPLKEEYFGAALRDLVSLPFDAVMESLDQGLEDASDSGHSSDTVTDVMLSPSSGATSPDQLGDISIDTLDAISDVSSTSDLGSMGSVGSPHNGVLPHSFTPALVTSLPTPVEEGDAKPLSVPQASVAEKTPLFLTTTPATSAFGQTRHLTTIHPSTIKLSSPSSTTTSSATTLSPQFSTGQPSIATRSIKLELAPNSPRVVKQVTTSNTSSSSTITNRSPILTKVRLDTSGAASTPRLTTNATSKTNSPQTIVVTQAGKGNTLLRNGTLLKAGTGRSILLPVNVNDLNQVRTIKIISASSANTVNRPGSSSGVRTLVSTVRPVSTLANGSNTNRTTFYTTSKGSDGRSLLKVTPTALVTPNTHSDVSRVTVPSSYNDDDASDEETPLPNQELVLNEEERRLMRKEGLVLPSRYPLTKQEERDLKRIRRKIRNKISAQDSRKRKKEYVDGLEDRVKNCTEENQQLQKRIKTLEKQNESLIAQLKKFQTLVGGSIYANRSHHHTSTALMMLILSAALFVVPSLRSQDAKGDNELTRNNKMPSPGHSRTLLEAKNSLNIQNMEGFSSADEDEIDPLTFSHALSDHDYSPAAKKPHLDSTTTSTFFPPLNLDKTLPLESGDPPDTIGGFNGVAAMIGAMLDRLGSNWTDPGGSFGGSLNRTPPHGGPERSSVVVNLPHGRRLRDDIELE